MKNWQRGFELELLKDYEKLFSSYNSFSDSPFSQIKKNDIALALKNEQFNTSTVNTPTGTKTLCYIYQTAARDSDIVLYKGVRIGTKRKGDIVYSAIATDAVDINTANFPNIFDKTQANWVYSWSDDRNLNQYLQKYKFKKIGSKITTFGEIKFIWFRDKEASTSQSVFGETLERIFPTLPKYETVSVKCVSKFNPITLNLVQKIAEKTKNVDNLFQNHYSNYNKRKSWSAFSLRGYKADPTFMTKPIEMNEEWQQDHSDEVFEMQDTTLMKDFPEVYQLLRHTFGSPIEYHRIRLMKLKSGDGELTRHTDQVDPDQGLAVGKLARFHFPIITNPDVKFTVWDIENKPNTVNMKVGECWVLDVRKPHAAINEGKEDRIHLVVDLIVTPEITKMLEAK
jgi:hypothetical protein